MKRKETTPVECAGDNYVLQRSTKGERSSKRCNVRSRASSEDTNSSGSSVKEDEVKSPWLLRDVVTSDEDEAHSSSVDAVKDGNGPLQGGEEALTIVNWLAQLQVRRYLGSITNDNERIWRKREDMSEEEVEVNNTFQGIVSILVSMSHTTSSQSEELNTRLSMVNQDITLRLPCSIG
jgi:hypothetical protein